MGLLDRLFGRRSTAAPSPRVGPPVFTVFDVETTGLSPRSDRIVELALVRSDASGQIVDSWSSRFNPNRPVGATHIHGITDADVASAPRFHEAASVIVSALRGTTLVAHNASFDVAFLQRELGLAGWDLPTLPTYCTLKASTHYLPQLSRRRLAECCEAAGVPLHHAHSALGDATATAHLLHSYLKADHSTRHGSTWSPVHAALAPPVHQSWPTQPSRAPHQPPPPSPSSARRYASPVKTTQISDALAASRGQIQISGDHTPETATYAELLLSCFQDGVLSAEERADLEQLARAQGVSTEHIHNVHLALITGLADLVIDSGRVPRSERQELIKVAEQLGIDQKVVVTAFKQAEIRRFTRLSAATKPLPPGWRLGEPLRVGDRVAFTGDAGDRDRQEADAARRGLRVTGSVSGRTDVLVWDGEMVGDKLHARHPYRRAERIRRAPGPSAAVPGGGVCPFRRRPVDEDRERTGTAHLCRRTRSRSSTSFRAQTSGRSRVGTGERDLRRRARAAQHQPRRALHGRAGADVADRPVVSSPVSSPSRRPVGRHRSCRTSSGPGSTGTPGELSAGSRSGHCWRLPAAASGLRHAGR